MRLTKVQKDIIVANLTATYAAGLHLNEKMKRLNKRVFDCYRNEETDKAILEFYNAHPEYFHMATENVDLKEFCAESGYYPSRYIYPSISWLYVILSKIKPNDIIKKHAPLSYLADDVAKASHLCYIFKSKCACVLEGITTDKKLSEEFPEAYKEYIAISGCSPLANNRCDSTEDLRALLNSTKDKSKNKSNK